MDESNIIIKLGLTVIVVIPSVWTILKSQYDKFKVIVIVDKIRFGMHKWDNGDRYETRYFLPIKFVNKSNSIGTITDLRLKVKYKIWGPFFASEIYKCDYELIDSKEENFSYDARGDLIENIVKREFSPIVLKSHQIYETHFMFRYFWENTRIIDKYQVCLQIRCNRSMWQPKGRWNGYLSQNIYNVFIANNTTFLLNRIKFGVEKFKLYKYVKKYMRQMITKKYSKEVKMEKFEIGYSDSEW